MAQRLLNKGAVGMDVRQLQGGLNGKAQYSAKDGNNKLPALVVDGIFGPKTQAKVIEFQKREKLAADGIAGPKTVGAIFLPNLTQVVSSNPVAGPLPANAFQPTVASAAIANAIAAGIKGVKFPRPGPGATRPAPPNKKPENIFSPTQNASQEMAIMLGIDSLYLRNATVAFGAGTPEYPLIVQVTANARWLRCLLTSSIAPAIPRTSFG